MSEFDSRGNLKAHPIIILVLPRMLIKLHLDPKLNGPNFTFLPLRLVIVAYDVGEHLYYL
jgi:hypothetical protein